MTEKIRNLSFVVNNGRKIPRVPTELCFADWLGNWTVRLGIRRMKYTVEPGIYAVGKPDSESVVLVSANYKLSFDALRKELGGLDAWIIVLDTKGINVWCAAGKGTFGTDEIVHRVGLVELEKIVNHRKIILPQLGAPGVAAHEVKKRCGFSVIYGPIRACDIIDFLKAGMKATQQMRQVHFSFYDRLVLTPVEFVMGGKYMILIMAVLFILSGIGAGGYSIDLAMSHGFRSVLNIFVAFLSGAVITPLLLPWLPGRSFSFKGFSVGFVVAVVLFVFKLTGSWLETVGWIFLVSVVSSFLAMNFTGASTYTSLSGVKKEMRVAVPLQVITGILGMGMWIAGRFI
jgi:hypothetical protein